MVNNKKNKIKELLKTFLSNIPVLKILFKNFITTRNKKKFYGKIKSNVPILVYQMGKVASTSVYRSIRDQYKGQVLHIHKFYKTHERDYVRYLFEIYQKEKVDIKIISLIREPISRNISAFFEHFKKIVGTDFKNTNYTPEELQRVFLDKYPHEYSLNWFDDNIKKNFGIDVFAYPFSEQGFIEINNKNISLLIIKHDLADNIKESVIAKFLSISDFILESSNKTSDKVYSQMYKNLTKLKYPDWYVKKMLHSKYSNHFYKNEVKQLIQKWS